jgi:glycosyltransferase involved in cell wall biosynthesis
MRLVICWTDLTGYMASCWRALAGRRRDIELQVVVFAPRTEAHQRFNESLLEGLSYRLLTQEERFDPKAVRAIVAAHRPDAVMIPGWYEPGYRRLCWYPELAQTKFIMGMDNPWKHTWQQRMARLRIGRYVDRMDAVVVAGERAWQFARRLKVPERKIFRGVYGFDLPLFDGAYEQRLANGPWPRRFLFMGRYVPLKGFDFLLPAYRKYRTMVSDPWPFTFCGQGPMQGLIAAEAGAEDWGFCQPSDQPGVMARHGVFVIASWYEAWSVALAEAMAAGLPAICTEEVGATVDLIRACHNGLTVPTRDADGLADALKWMHDHYDRLPTMGQHARQFASAHSAELWAERYERMLQKIGF